MITAGIVSVDPERKWIGGRYYLQHLIRSVAALPSEERVELADVWWGAGPEDDAFAEVRPYLARSRILTLPASQLHRILRKMRRLFRGWPDSRDLFLDAGIDVLFPITPCANPGIPLVFWMPDFQPWRMPELFSDELRAWFAGHYETNGAAASRIVVSSRYGLEDLQQFLPQFRDKARVLHFCSIPTPDWWEADPAATALRYGLPTRFFLLPNQFSHHKNHLVVFEAVRLLRERGVSVCVVCTGSRFGFRGDDYMEGVEVFLRQHQLESSIRILGLIPRSDQIALMRRAVALLQPSRFEGWSTVVEDAKTLGQQIVLSDIGVHREQAPPGGRYAAVSDPEEWAASMEELWTSRREGPHETEEDLGASLIQQASLRTGRDFVSILREAALS